MALGRYQTLARDPEWNRVFDPLSEKCTQPCWLGVRLGVTSLAAVPGLVALDARATDIENRNPSVAWQVSGMPAFAMAYRWPGRPGNEVQGIDVMFDASSDFRLGAAIALWGSPIGEIRYMCRGADSENAGADIYFSNNVIVRSPGLFNNWGGQPFPADLRLTPFSPVEMVRFYANTNDMVGKTSNPWKGFSRWREAQLAHRGSCQM
jgi:hypothetical protein